MIYKGKWLFLPIYGLPVFYEIVTGNDCINI